MKIAIITGASSGMGRELARQVAKEGMCNEIWAIARREERLVALEDELSIPLRPFAMDLTNYNNITHLKALLEEEQAKIMLLANCSGFAKFGTFDEISEEDTLMMIDLNIRALVGLTQVCIPHMAEGGMIMQFASTASFQPLPALNVYAASKSFVLSYSRALNKELQPHDISVTTVCPGWTKTEFVEVAKKDADSKAVGNFLFMSTPQKVVAKALKDTKNRKELSIYGITNIFHMIFAKLLPASAIMSIWSMMK